MDNLTKDIVDGLKYAIMENSYIKAGDDETVLLPDVVEVYMVNSTAIGITCVDGLSYRNYVIKITEV